MTLDDLNRFCSSDETRSPITRPFSQGSWTYATDGRIMIRVPRMAEVPEYDESPKNCQGLFDNNPITQQWFKVPSDLPKGEPCEHCDGSGVHECTCEHEHQCGFCDGTGESLKAIPVKVGNQLAAHTYLRLISTLPNVDICNSAKDKMSGLGIRFDGGEGLLMPMRE